MPKLAKQKVTYAVLVEHVNKAIEELGKPSRSKQSVLEGVSYIGIDPGSSSGGLAMIYPSGKINSIPMPGTERDIWQWFVEASYYSRKIAMIEKVHAMPGNGVVGMFKFGQNYGFLRACLIAAEFQFEEVIPHNWQKSLEIPKRNTKKESQIEFKNRLRGFAQQQFPKAEVKKNTADALLLALYCQRKHLGLLK